MNPLLAGEAHLPAWLPLAAGRVGDWAAGVWVWGGLFLAVASVGLVVLVLVRRRLSGRGRQPSASWSLQDIREMRDAGLLTDSEYAALRERVLKSPGLEPGGSAPAQAGGEGVPDSPGRQERR